MVVHGHREMVGWKPVGLQDHEIIEQGILKSNGAAKKIVEDRLAFIWHLKADNRRPTIAFPFCSRATLFSPAAFVVARRLMILSLLGAQGIEALGRAIA